METNIVPAIEKQDNSSVLKTKERVSVATEERGIQTDTGLEDVEKLVRT
jgi:hypothetical protein